MTIVTRSMSEDLKYMSDMIDEKLAKFKLELSDSLLNDIRKEIKDEFEAFAKIREDKIIELESTVAI